MESGIFIAKGAHDAHVDMVPRSPYGQYPVYPCLSSLINLPYFPSEAGTSCRDRRTHTPASNGHLLEEQIQQQ